MTAGDLGGAAASSGPTASSGNGHGKVVRPRTAVEVQEWFVNFLADALQKPADEIDPSAPFESFGLDSVTAVGMTGYLEEWLGLPIDPMLVYDYPTIEALAGHLADRTREGPY